MDATKCCKKCGVEKPLTGFHRKQYYYRTVCNACVSAEYKKKKMKGIAKPKPAPVVEPLVVAVPVLSREEIRKRRYDLSQEQSQLDLNHCNPCTIKQTGRLEACKGCPIYDRLSQIGDELCSLSRIIKKQSRETEVFHNGA